MIRAALYARYSSDLQNENSNEDQFRIGGERLEREGWQLAGRYSDEAISGASLFRPGIQRLLSDVAAGKIDIVLCEALDRISRDQEDIAAFYKRCKFAGVTIFTLSEGEISELHIGLKGTMNAIFLKDLASKTHRGMRGRVEQGKSGGGNSYGYDVVKQFDPNTGEAIRGDRTINETEAEIVGRIFDEYIRGMSPRMIATRLNKEGIAGPQGGAWGASTLYGNRQRGTGILNNELYIGRLVWNRQRFVKDPITRKRVAKYNPESAWIIRDVPEMRIISDEVWQKTKAIQGDYNHKNAPLWKKNRPKSLLSNLTKCGCCGAGYTMMSANRIGCSAAREKGNCDNRLTIPRETVEQMVLNALCTHLMDEASCAEFCKEYTRRMNELRREHNMSLAGYRGELAKLKREREKIIDATLNGVSPSLYAARSHTLQARLEELEALLAEVKEEPVVFHPNMADRYHAEIRNLIASFHSEETRLEASGILRSLIDRIVLTPTPEKDRLTVDLIGDLSGILAIATNRDKAAVKSDLTGFEPIEETPENIDSTAQMAVVAGVRSNMRFRDVNKEGGLIDLPSSFNRNAMKSKQMAMVAGARFELTTFRL